jgi:hypothetical protein
MIGLFPMERRTIEGLQSPSPAQRGAHPAPARRERGNGFATHGDATGKRFITQWGQNWTTA